MNLRYILCALLTLGMSAVAQKELTFNGACDASAAVALDARTFVVADDENNILRIYSLDKPGMPLAQYPMGRFLKTNVGKHPEADIEAATRIGDRIYWITSHGRSKKGKWRTSRYLFFATKIIKEGGAYRLEPEGAPCRDLLPELLKVPDLGLARAVGRLGADAQADLAPKLAGMNIEGLTAGPDGEFLYLGLRNPRHLGNAVLVPLMNPAAVIDAGARPELGKAMTLNFGGRGIRSMEYSKDHGAYLVVAGSHASARISALFSWDGVAGSKPKQLKKFDTFNAEALVPIAGTQRLQVFSDDGTVMYPAKPKDSIEPLEDGQCACKTLVDPRRKAFRSLAIDLSE